ncbi:MAG: hypothetical protein H6696_13070 [Deferribacteres bacterium]|nr:hypothetical protein [candidate division KSB1 bacterium]MCB9502861.1 hypothetical protein [Deferribacteres bacterium]
MSFFTQSPIDFWDETRTIDNITIHSLHDLLGRSKATEAFKEAVREFVKKPEPNSHIQFGFGTPALKVFRSIMKLLETHPEIIIEAVVVGGHSGCANFIGTIEVQPDGRKFGFNWNCQWRARENDVKNAWGMPDQIKAAYDFGYQCFQSFEEMNQE